jgi:tetratricopeptide (TPR) repeat protein
MSGEDSNGSTKPNVKRPFGDGARTLSRALTELAELEYRLGDWPAAYMSAVESLRRAKFAGHADETMSALIHLALVEAGLGRADACQRHAAEAIELSRRHGSKTVEAGACEAVGFLELGLGRIDAAMERLGRAGEICAEHPSAWTSAVTWAQDLVDACVRAGDPVAAGRALTRLEERASDSGSCVLASALERSRAMLAADDRFEKIFERALRWAVRARQPFEQARTELCFGERLCRAGRHAKARKYLLDALHTFEALAAEPWADRAREGLAAAGAGSPRDKPATVLPAQSSLRLPGRKERSVVQGSVNNGARRRGSAGSSARLVPLQSLRSAI